MKLLKLLLERAGLGGCVEFLGPNILPVYFEDLRSRAAFSFLEGKLEVHHPNVLLVSFEKSEFKKGFEGSLTMNMHNAFIGKQLREWFYLFHPKEKRGNLALERPVLGLTRWR